MLRRLPPPRNFEGIQSINTTAAAAVPVDMPLLDQTIAVLKRYAEHTEQQCLDLIKKLRKSRKYNPSEFIAVFLSGDLRAAFLPHIIAERQGEGRHIIDFAAFVARNMDTAQMMQINSQPAEILIIGGPRPARRPHRCQQEDEAPPYVEASAANHDDDGHIVPQPTAAAEPATPLAPAVHIPPEASILHTTANLDDDSAIVGWFCGCC